MVETEINTLCGLVARLAFAEGLGYGIAIGATFWAVLEALWGWIQRRRDPAGYGPG